MIKKAFQFLVYWSIRIIAKICSFTLYRMRVFGSENVPKDGPLLLLSNHQSFLDPLFCQVTQKHTLHFLARDTLFRNKFFGSLIRTLKAKPIKRGKTDMAAMRTTIETLKQGKAVCLFPEGTRTLDGRIQEIKPGLSLLSRRSGAVAMPVVIDGAFECWPKERKYPKIGKVGIIFGKPFTADEIKSLGDKKFAAMFTARLREMQCELREKLNRQPFDYTDSSQKAPDDTVQIEST
ncbi:MAG: 1-acyl-sn-glycerol-3-phosphate acyltransferase [Anaerohalosphaera sp.]|nr:1-acyl-sn-glycerol-3-phosphate acyltransferase [Anaerohalosphaera sp.]